MNALTDGGELSGVTVVVTRAADQAEPFVRAIHKQGGEALLIPALHILDRDPGDAHLRRLAGDVDGPAPVIVFTSPNAVRSCTAALRARGRTLRVDAPLVSIGAGTETALAALGLSSQRPRSANAESLIELPMLRQGMGQKLCIVKGQGGRDVLSPALSARGWDVMEIISYTRSMPASDLTVSLEQWRLAPQVVCTFMSGDTARNLVQMVQDYGESATSMVQSTPAVVISRRVEQILLSLEWTGPVAVATGTSVEEQLRGAVELLRIS